MVTSKYVIVSASCEKVSYESINQDIEDLPLRTGQWHKNVISYYTKNFNIFFYLLITDLENLEEKKSLAT